MSNFSTTIPHVYHVENKLNSMKWWRCPCFVLWFYTNTLLYSTSSL